MSKLSLDVINKLAQKFRVDNDVSDSEAINLKSFLRKLGVLTIFKPMSSDFFGMSLKSPSGAGFILVNSNNPKGRQHFTIAHELYHLFNEDNPTPHVCKQGVKSVSESNADAFASAFLMPEKGMLSFISAQELQSKSITLSTVLKLQQYFCVSHSAMLIRLSSCKLISKADYEKMHALKPMSIAREYGYDTSLYRGGNEGLVIGDFGEKARLLYDREVISEGHYNELINLISDEQ